MPPRRRAKSIQDQPSSSSPPPPNTSPTVPAGLIPRTTRSRKSQSSLTIEPPRQQSTTRAPLSAPSTGTSSSWTLPQTSPQLESQRRSSRVTAVKARETIREAILPPNQYNSATARVRRASINSTNNNQIMRIDNTLSSTEATLNTSPLLTAATPGFSPKKKTPPGLKQETSDTKLLDTILQNGGTNDFQRGGRKGSLSNSVKSGKETNKTVDPVNGTDLPQNLDVVSSTETNNSGQEVNLERESVKEVNEKTITRKSDIDINMQDMEVSEPIKGGLPLTEPIDAENR
jgi:hypothetical protein